MYQERVESIAVWITADCGSPVAPKAWSSQAGTVRQEDGARKAVSGRGDQASRPGEFDVCIPRPRNAVGARAGSGDPPPTRVGIPCWRVGLVSDSPETEDPHPKPLPRGEGMRGVNQDREGESGLRL